MGLGSAPEQQATIGLEEDSVWHDEVEVLEKLGLSAAFPAIYTGFVGYAYAMSGQRVEAVRMVAELEERSKREYLPATAPALIYKWALHLTHSAGVQGEH